MLFFYRFFCFFPRPIYQQFSELLIPINEQNNLQDIEYKLGLFLFMVWLILSVNYIFDSYWASVYFSPKCFNIWLIPVEFSFSFSLFSFYFLLLLSVTNSLLFFSMTWQTNAKFCPDTAFVDFEQTLKFATLITTSYLMTVVLKTQYFFFSKS